MKTPDSPSPAEERPGIPDPVTDLARTVFGIAYLYPWQRLVIANILDAIQAPKNAPESDPDDIYDEDGALRGRQIVLLPTGAGKSLCFQLPALCIDGPTLVIYPLLALMGDQLRRLKDCGLDPVIFRGAQSPQERDTEFRKLEGREGTEPARLIIANPEVLSTGALLERIAARKIAHIAIDEAHCVSEWGDTFRPAYLELGNIIRRIDPPAVTAFTATASPAVLSRIAQVLFDGAAHLVRGDSDRPNIQYSVQFCRAKEAALIREVTRRERPMVIFCATRGGTERTAHLLREFLDDSDIRFYHAGLQKDEKKTVEAWFHGHERGILVTTCAWGMGVDKKNVRTVIHRDAPPTAEAYAQESGRGGRDGKTAQAVLLWSPAEKKRFARLPDLQRNRAMSLVHLAESGRCRREVLLSALGETRADAKQTGGEQIACSGCDVCNRSARFSAGDEEVVREYIRRNPRCFSREQIVTSLYTAGNRLALARSGFREWQRTDFTLIIDELEKEGVISEQKYWPWKGKLSICRTGTSCPPSPLRTVFRLPLLPERKTREELPADVPSFSSGQVSVSGNGQCN